MSSGSRRSITVNPRGESGCEYEFAVDGQHFNSGDQGYFESSGGYRIAVTIEPDLQISVLVL